MLLLFARQLSFADSLPGCPQWLGLSQMSIGSPDLYQGHPHMVAGTQECEPSMVPPSYLLAGSSAVRNEAETEPQPLTWNVISQLAGNH